MLYMVTFTINIPQMLAYIYIYNIIYYIYNIYIYQHHGSYGVYHDPTLDFRWFTAFSEPRIPGFEDATSLVENRDEI